MSELSQSTLVQQAYIVTVCNLFGSIPIYLTTNRDDAVRLAHLVAADVAGYCQSEFDKLGWPVNETTRCRIYRFANGWHEADLGHVNVVAEQFERGCEVCQ